jgi:hypothetical protein
MWHRLATLVLVCALGGSRAYHVAQGALDLVGVPYALGVRHIHSPAHCVPAHGLALPGFRITETRPPRRMSEFVASEFTYRTYLSGGPAQGRLFSSAPDTSHLLLMDPDGIPCLLARLKVVRLPGGCGHRVETRAALLRLPTPWERLLLLLSMARSREGRVRRSVLRCAFFFTADGGSSRELTHYLALVLQRGYN